MQLDDELAAPAAAEDSAPAPHISESIPVQSNQPEPVVTAKDDATPVVDDAAPADVDAAAGDDVEGRKPVQKLPDWAQKKIADTAFEAREANRRAKALEDELAALRSGAPADAATTATDEDAARAAAPDGGYKTKAEFDAAVQAEANRRANAEREAGAINAFNQRCNDVYEAGTKAHGDDFAAAVQNLQNVGVMNKDVLDVVLELDNPSDVLLALGADPDKASSLLAMTPAKRAIELTRMSASATPKKADPVSKAPAPIRPVEGTAKPSTEPRDDDDDAAWFAKREAQLAARRA